MFFDIVVSLITGLYSGLIASEYIRYVHLRAQAVQLVKSAESHLPTKLWMKAMNIITDAIDEAVLALLYLTVHDDNRAWKSFDWEALNRLHERGFLANPVNKAKSVVLTEEGCGGFIA